MVDGGGAQSFRSHSLRWSSPTLDICPIPKPLSNCFYLFEWKFQTSQSLSQFFISKLNLIDRFLWSGPFWIGSGQNISATTNVDWLLELKPTLLFCLSPWVCSFNFPTPKLSVLILHLPTRHSIISPKKSRNTGCPSMNRPDRGMQRNGRTSNDNYRISNTKYFIVGYSGFNSFLLDACV